MVLLLLLLLMLLLLLLLNMLCDCSWCELLRIGPLEHEYQPNDSRPLEQLRLRVHCESAEKRPSRQDDDDAAAAAPTFSKTRD